jgi:hypothetical protein
MLNASGKRKKKARMIIKSMARKQPSFRELVEYFHKEASQAETLCHNLWGEDPGAAIADFEQNHGFLPTRKGANSLYHEIISLPQNVDWARDRQEQALLDLGRRYLQERAPDQLGYGVIHYEREHLHLHLCLSSNAAGSKTRHRLPKAQFAAIQRDLEGYQRETYPELGQEQRYGQKRAPQAVRAREGQMKQHQRKPTQKEQVKQILQMQLDQAENHSAFKAALVAEGWQLYQRAGVWGVEKIDTGRRYRLKTLGQAEFFAEAERRWALQAQREQELQQLRQAQERKRDRDRER